MSLILAALLASNQALPFIDRPALRTLARREAARPTKALALRNDRDVAHLCSTAPNLVDSPSNSVGRAYSMSGPEVSILRTTCALRRSSFLAAKPTRLAAR